MNDKLKGFKTETKTEDDVVNALEVAPEELAPDPETIVPTGDEDGPVSTPDHSEGLKSLYSKARGTREHTMREDAGDADVERVQRLMNEAAGGEQTEQLDTNMPDRFAADRGEETEEQYLARLMEEEQQQQNDTGTETPEEKDVNSASDSLQDDVVDAMVDVKILGRTLSVPQQDIDDAGGKEAYQKSRSATIKLQRAATLEKEAQRKLDELDTKRSGQQQEADPSTDGLSEADIASLREEMLDAVVDGSEEDIDAWIAEKLKPKTISQPETTASTVSHDEVNDVASETLEELEALYEADRVEANKMMRDEYPDILRDPELLGLAQQRFNVIKTNPLNEGRSQKDMARESANFVRGLGKRLEQPTVTDPAERERQERITRKRQLPSQSRADKTAPSQAPKKTTVPTRKEHLARLRRRAGHDLAG